MKKGKEGEAEIVCSTEKEEENMIQFDTKKSCGAECVPLLK